MAKLPVWLKEFNAKHAVLLDDGAYVIREDFDPGWNRNIIR